MKKLKVENYHILEYDGVWSSRRYSLFWATVLPPSWVSCCQDGSKLYSLCLYLACLPYSSEDGSRLHGITSQKVVLFSHFHENNTSHKIHTSLQFDHFLKSLLFYILNKMLQNIFIYFTAIVLALYLRSWCIYTLSVSINVIHHNLCRGHEKSDTLQDVHYWVRRI